MKRNWHIIAMIVVFGFSLALLPYFGLPYEKLDTSAFYMNEYTPTPTATAAAAATTTATATAAAAATTTATATAAAAATTTATATAAAAATTTATPTATVTPGVEEGNISGTVYAPGGTTGLANITVVVYQYNGSWWRSVSWLSTDSSGAYQASNLASGTYRVGVFDWRWPNREYGPKYYPNATTLDDAADVVINGGATTSGIDVTMDDPGQITGTVTNSSGSAISGIYVNAYSYNGRWWQWAGWARTDATGQYTVSPLSTGTYRIGLFDWSNNLYRTQYYLGAVNIRGGTDISVTAGATTSGRDVQMTEGGRITGSVTDSSGTALSYAYITAYRQDSNGNWRWAGWGRTNSSGQYTVGKLGSGTYRVRVSKWRYAPTYYVNSSDLNGATDVLVTDEVETPNINVSLLGPGNIAGTVTYANGNPVSNVRVKVFRQNGSNWQWIYNWTFTNSQGQYNVSNVPAGSYRVGFFDRSGGISYQYYNNAADANSGADVVVNSSQTTSNINAQLPDPAPPVAEASLTTGVHGSYISTDPVTGKLVIGQSVVSSYQSNITISKVITCTDETTPTDVLLTFDGETYSMSENPAGSGKYSGTIPKAALKGLSGSKDIKITYNCSGVSNSVDVGKIVLYDPSGYLTDAVTGEPVIGATVTLYKVPEWRAKTSTDDNEENTCQSNLSKGEDDPWSQAVTEEGVVADPDSGEIDPAVNPLVSDQVGHYAWDVAAGCWYVVVEAEGYERKISPLVGVPPEVTDLDLELTPLSTPSETPPGPSNQPPQVSSAMPDITVVAGSVNQIINPFSYFNDPEGDNVKFYVTGNSNSAVVPNLTVGLELGNVDQIAIQFGTAGETEITIQAKETWSHATVEDTFKVTVLSQGILAVSKSVSDDTVSPGQRLTYRISIDNTGVSTATQALISDALPAGLSFVSGSISASGLTVGTIGSALPTLASGVTVQSGQSAQLTYAVTVDESVLANQRITNTVKVTGPEISTAIQASHVIQSNAPGLSIANAIGSESDGTMTFTVNLSRASAIPVAVNYTTVSGTATGNDYTATSGTLTIEAGSTSGTITVNIANDGVSEENETFTVLLSSPADATISNGQAVGTIADQLDPNDDDADGIDNAIEGQVPNPSGSGTGDGNGDGIPDGSQQNVASLPNSTTGEYVTFAAAGNEVLTNVQAQASPTNAPNGAQFPQGLFSWGVAGVTGDVVIITVNLHTSDSTNLPNSYWKFGPTPDDQTDHWYNFTFDSATGTGAEINGNTITLRFVDGKRGDSDLQANGQIADPGGPVVFQPPTALDLSDFNAQESKQWQIWLLLGMMLTSASAAMIWRNKRE